MFVSAVLVASALTATHALAATQTITVGANGQRKFSPDNIQAALGDVIEFQFVAGMYSATQSTFADPCKQLVNATTNTVGFDSGFVPGNAAAPQSFSIAVNTTKPIWVYCKQTGDCAAGMVMAINAPATGNTFDAFLAAATGGSAAGATSGATTAAAPGTTAGGNSTDSGATPSSSSKPGAGYKTTTASNLAVGLSGLVAVALAIGAAC